MASFIIIGIAALVAALLTLFSGFGLGTLLMPVFALFFPIEIAVAATAIVHAANNVFKIGVVGRHADSMLVLRFGLPAIVAAFVGAATLAYFAHFVEIARYMVGAREAVITPIKLLMALLMFLFALFELLPRFRKLKFDQKHLVLGGLLSGFFGGLSGHQGALRSAFLAKVSISTPAFIGTNAIIGFLVDLARLTTYAVMFLVLRETSAFSPDLWPLILTGVIAAFVGVMIGKRFLDKVTMRTVQTLTGTLLLVIAAGLGSGLI